MKNSLIHPPPPLFCAINKIRIAVKMSATREKQSNRWELIKNSIKSRDKSFAKKGENS